MGGVCGGIGEYPDLDPTLIRIIFIYLSKPLT
ncbi:MAG: PspC domain-containing protein [Syntrophales bacterium]